MDEKHSLLMKSLQDELADYKELEQYTAPKRSSKGDERFSLYVRIIAMTENGDMDVDEETLDALLDLDGVLGYCWDLYWQREVPVNFLYRELLHCYKEGEVW